MTAERGTSTQTHTSPHVAARPRSSLEMASTHKNTGAAL